MINSDFLLFRCSCFLGHMFRVGILNVDDCLGNQSTSVQGLCLTHLHTCSCSSLQRCERHICEIETEDCKSAPCKNGATGTHLYGYFFGKCFPGFTGK